MCIETSQEFLNKMKHVTVNKKSTNATYNIKKVLKALFKKQQATQVHVNSKAKSLESLESLDNLMNSQNEVHYEEIEENAANEKLISSIYDEITTITSSADHEIAEDDVYVPVRFARTDAGTFFWTTNLQPVIGIVPVIDNDLIQPAFCYSNSQHPHIQYQDRWAQA